MTARQSSSPLIIAVGGGKGGTGKSTVAISLAYLLSRSGERVVLADLDFGGANLHTMLGMQHTGKSVIHFLYPNGDRPAIEQCLTPTEADRLQLLSGMGFVPGIANMEYFRKQKLMRALKKLPAEFVVCDLGAGTSFNVVDFFLLADQGILLLTGEATAILNGYEFLKNCIFRRLSRAFARDPHVRTLINGYKNAAGTGRRGLVQDLIRETAATAPEAAARMRRICRSFRPAMVLNQEQCCGLSIGERLNGLSNKYLNVGIEFLGALAPEPALRRGVISLLRQASVAGYKKDLEKLVGFVRSKRKSPPSESGKSSTADGRWTGVNLGG